MTTFVVLAAGFVIGAMRGVFTLLIWGAIIAVVSLAVTASEGLIRAITGCIGRVFVLDAGFILAIAASVLLRNLLSDPAAQGDAGKAGRNGAYGSASRPRG